MTWLNQLSQLSYLNVRVNVLLSCQIRGLRHLETLDLFSSKEISNIALEIEIADVPCLCHLVVPWCTRLPDRIGMLKSLRTLHNFILPINSLESIIGLGQLTALSDLGFIFPKECAPLEKVACMEALSTSLEKLRNLRKLYMCFSSCGKVAWRADVLSSPTFHNLEELNMIGCTFSRVPRWIGHLQDLRMLWLGVKQMIQEDVAIIGAGAPSLLRLSLRIAGILTDRIVIRGSMGFASVKYFEFNCDCISYLSFEARAMPELRELKLVFDTNEWDKATPGGLQHLPSLKEMEAQRSCYNTIEWWGRYHASNGKDANKTKVELISGVFQKVVDPLPTCPTFIFKDGWFERPVEEEECVTDAGTEDDTIAHPTSGAAVGPQPRRSSRPKLPNTRVTGNEWATP